MADLNHIRGRLLEIMKPAESSANASADLIGLYEEWGSWTSDAEVDVVSDLLESTGDPRFVRMLIQFLKQPQTPRALARLHRLAQHSTKSISDDALRALEKNGTLSAQRLLLDWALHDPDHHHAAFAALTRCATLEIVEDLQLALLTSTDKPTLLGILSLFKKLKATQSIRSLLDVLRQSSDPAIQEQAIFSIAHLGKRKHLVALRPYSDSQEPSVRRAVFFAMARLGGRREVGKMVSIVTREIDRGVCLSLLKDLRQCSPGSTKTFELLADWASRTEDPGARYWAGALLSRWSEENPRIIRKSFLDKSLANPNPALAILLLHQAAFTSRLSSRTLAELAQQHSHSSVRAAALESLGTSLSELSRVLPAKHGLAAFLKDGSAEVRMNAAALIGRFAPKEALEFLLEEVADPQTLRSFFSTMSRQRRARDLSGVLLERLAVLAQKGDRTTRTLSISLLAQCEDPSAMSTLQQIAAFEREKKLAIEAAWGLLFYASRRPCDLDTLLGPLFSHRRTTFLMIIAARRLIHEFPKPRKSLALRIGVYLSQIVMPANGPLSNLSRHWLLFFRALCRDLEGDLLEWFSIGSLTPDRNVWLVRVVRSLLNRRTLRMNFSWLSKQMRNPNPLIRQQTASLLAHHFPWSTLQTRQLIRWRLTDTDEGTRQILDRHIRQESLGFVVERRTTRR